MRNKILVIGMIGLAIALMACGGNSAQPTSAATVAAPTDVLAQVAATEVQPTQAAPTEAAATQAAAAPVNTMSAGGQGVPIGNIKDVLNKACDALKAQDNLNTHITITGDQTGDIVYQIAGKDHAHFVVTMGGNTHETIILPTGLYSNSSGKWKEDKMPSATFATQMISTTRDATGLFVCFNQSDTDQQPLSGEITGLAANVALPEVVNSVPCLVYNVNVSVKTADSQGTGEATYWLGAADSLPYKLAMTYAGTKSDGTKTNGQISSTYSYEATDIKAPIP